MPVELHPKQQAFVDCEDEEVLFGGQSGSGKSFAALAAALRWAHVPGYSGLVLRRRLTDLAMNGGLLDVSHAWLRDSKAHYSGDLRQWRFPSGAVLTFGFIEASRDKYRYQSAQYQQVVWDELTQHPEEHYEFLFSRLRAPEGVPVPCQMRATSNPGGEEGHEWVKRRFLVEGEAHGRVFIPSTLDDNPSLDRETYRRNLEKLDPLTRAHLLHGDWDATPAGGMFQRSWFIAIPPHEVPKGLRWVRAWDRAASVPKKGTDPDWTVGVKIGQQKGRYFIADLHRFRATSQGNAERIRRIAELDGTPTSFVLEEEPGSAGKDQTDYYRREVLKGFNVKSIRSTGDKVDRAGPLASGVEAGNVLLVSGGLWLNDFVDELVSFPRAAHDDQVDAAALGFSQASSEPFGRIHSFRVSWL